MRLMILGYHTIISAYGFWLPNDPRGSWSDFVRQWELLVFGKATKVDDGRCRARDEHDIRRRRDAKTVLTYPAVHFTGVQARAIGRGFAHAIAESGYIVHACSILPDHAHLVIARHERNVRKIAGHLKARATRQLNLEHIHPLGRFAKESMTAEDGSSQLEIGNRGSTDSPSRATSREQLEIITPSPWARNSWSVFIDNDAQLHKAIAYVENNPIKEGKPRQQWGFVTPCAR